MHDKNGTKMLKTTATLPPAQLLLCACDNRFKSSMHNALHLRSRVESLIDQASDEAELPSELNHRTHSMLQCHHLCQAFQMLPTIICKSQTTSCPTITQHLYCRISSLLQNMFLEKMLHCMYWILLGSRSSGCKDVNVECTTAVESKTLHLVIY